MKHLKKLASVLLALVMALALMAPAFAATATTAPIEISLTQQGGEGHVLKVYQIFKAAVADAKSLKSDTIVWGDYVTPETLIKALQGATEEKNGFPGTLFSDTALGVSADAPYNSGIVAKNLAKIFADNFEKTGAPYAAKKQELADVIGRSNAFSKGVTVGSAASVDKIYTGYALITDGTSDTDANPNFILKQLLASGPISPKTGTSTVTKQVKQSGDDGKWSDAAIYEKGEEYNLKLTATLPDNLLSKYKGKTIVEPAQKDGKNNPNVGLKGFWIRFHDVQDAGMDFVANSIVVTLYDADGNPVKTNNPMADNLYKTTMNPTTDECTFDLLIESIEDLTGVEPGGKIVVEYKAKLNDNAVTGTAGNNNKVWLETPDGETTEDNIKVYETELVLDKVDGAGVPLPGAEFKLFHYSDCVGEDGKLLDQTEIVKKTPAYELTANKTEIKYTETNADGSTTEKTLPAETRFSVKDIEAGKYVLVETRTPTKSPDGQTDVTYNTMTPTVIEITATTEEVTGSEGGKLILNVTGGGFTVTETDEVLVETTEPGEEGGETTVTKTITRYKGSIAGQVENLTGTQLPETGGIGTTIFYIVGGVLVVGAVVLLITKRRAGADEE